MENEYIYKIIKIVVETSEAKTYILNEISGKKINFLPGQFLTFSISIDGEELRRTYSISSAPFELPNISITIKKSLSGNVSNYLVDNLKEGDILKAFPPLGKFTVEPSSETCRQLILFGAGSGITPLMSIIRSILYLEKQSTITLIYVNRNLDSIIYRKELDELEQLYNGRLKVIHILSQPGEEWKGLKGRINSSMAVDLLNQLNVTKETHFYICGPTGMTNEILNTLEKLNIEAERIHTEYFSVIILQNAQDDDIEIKARKVTIIIDGKEHIVNVEPNDTILSSALEQGLDIPNSCNIGQCSTCKAKLISGKINLVEQTALSDSEIAQGYCLTCVGFPLSDDIVIDYDATKNF